MTDPRRALWLVVLAAACGAGCGGSNDTPPSVAPPPPPADLDKQVDAFCSRCHAFPPADTFPRSAWKDEVEQAYRFAAAASMPGPPIDNVITYFEQRAP